MICPLAVSHTIAIREQNSFHIPDDLCIEFSQRGTKHQSSSPTYMGMLICASSTANIYLPTTTDAFTPHDQLTLGHSNPNPPPPNHSSETRPSGSKHHSRAAYRTLARSERIGKSQHRRSVLLLRLRSFQLLEATGIRTSESAMNLKNFEPRDSAIATPSIPSTYPSKYPEFMNCQKFQYSACVPSPSTCPFPEYFTFQYALPLVYSFQVSIPCLKISLRLA
jgi:hypothetical protein